ncbi:hypothetical protein LTR85_009980 [Meristemomyces frigidus]|nr:hypothetical protein LTR85_009980 [Meristemomyces frigidus]
MAESHGTEGEARFSPLMDKTPPEVRLRIFKEVLRADYPLLLASKQYPDEIRFNVSLLTVSKATYIEASDAFYEVNSIRLWQRRELTRAVKNDMRYLHFVRHLELVNVTETKEWLCKRTPSIIQTCRGLPKLKTLTVAYDALGQTECMRESMTLTAFLNLRDFAPTDVRCMGIGVFKLGDDEGLQVFFKHYAMVAAWKQLHIDADILGPGEIHAVLMDVMLEFPTGQINGIDQVTFTAMNRMDLNTWCAGYDLLRSGLVPGRDFADPFRLVARLLPEFARRLSHFPHVSPQTHPGLGMSVRLKDLDMKKDGAEVLGWFSEVLAVNSREFRFRKLL